MEKKVYNLKKSSLGKVTFEDGTAFCMITGKNDNGEEFREILIIKSLEELIKNFHKWSIEIISLNIKEIDTFNNKIKNWLIQNWMENGILSFKKELYENSGLEEIKNMGAIEFLNSEPEISQLILVHIATKYTSGHLKIPINELELSIRYIKNILAINFWDDRVNKEEE
ncbi:hypothetical protein [Spiroplasma cantharicola]|uniref:Uncharacterized protein n=1 Tax=Spiroplasma cantharicola TaxID=362837 RepID=A0A0M4KCG4_9MOLU|nr:hypothetical protein [Spiroplasma cantharicola]ALD66402.1 hypothetical protein SCANT_v1c04960 [Spiroplasma cantharicola]